MKRLLALLCSLTLLLLPPVTVSASGNGNMESGGGGMGQGTSANSWSPGNDGVRITVVDAETGTAVSTPIEKRFKKKKIFLRSKNLGILQ